MKKVYHKRVRSGNVTEFYSYENGVKVGEVMPPGHSRKKKLMVEEEREKKDKQNLQRSLSRTVTTLRRSINSNIGQWGDFFPKFMTLTFRENRQDHSEANAEFRAFVKRLSYKIFKKESGLKYTCVVERQKRGAIHYHVIFYNLPYIKFADLLGVWQRGDEQRGLRINAIKEIDNVGSYVVKYVSKEIEALKRGEGGQREKDKKIYFQSRGLKKPEEKNLSDEELKQELQDLEAQENTKVFESEFENEHIGKIGYKQVREIK